MIVVMGKTEVFEMAKPYEAWRGAVTTAAVSICSRRTLCPSLDAQRPGGGNAQPIHGFRA
jgi:hypothetical protein